MPLTAWGEVVLTGAVVVAVVVPKKRGPAERLGSGVEWVEESGCMGCRIDCCVCCCVEGGEGCCAARLPLVCPPCVGVVLRWERLLRRGLSWGWVGLIMLAFSSLLRG